MENSRVRKSENFLKGEYSMASVIMFIIGLLIGGGVIIVLCACAFYHSHKESSVGTLVIETSDDDGPYLFVELTKEPKVLTTKKYVTLQISAKSLIPPR
jgi:hypothetical protein